MATISLPDSRPASAAMMEISMATLVPCPKSLSVSAINSKGYAPEYFLETDRSTPERACVACTIFTILIGGLVFSRLLVITGVVSQFVDFIAGSVQSTGGLLALFSIMYIVLGCFLDTASIMVITLPFVFPVIVKFGIDPIWFGIIFVKLIEISVITPPVGLNLYAVMSGAGKDADFKDLALGVIPFLITDVITLFILIWFPLLSTWLPDTMIGK